MGYSIGKNLNKKECDWRLHIIVRKWDIQVESMLKLQTGTAEESYLPNILHSQENAGITINIFTPALALHFS